MNGNKLREQMVLNHQRIQNLNGQTETANQRILELSKLETEIGQEIKRLINDLGMMLIQRGNQLIADLSDVIQVKRQLYLSKQSALTSFSTSLTQVNNMAANALLSNDPVAASMVQNCLERCMAQPRTDSAVDLSLPPSVTFTAQYDVIANLIHRFGQINGNSFAAEGSATAQGSIATGPNSTERPSGSSVPTGAASIRPRFARNSFPPGYNTSTFIQSGQTPPPGTAETFSFAAGRAQIHSPASVQSTDLSVEVIAIRPSQRSSVESTGTSSPNEVLPSPIVSVVDELPVLTVTAEEMPDESRCEICRKATEEDLLRCSKCSRYFHSACHPPNVPTSGQFLCASCVDLKSLVNDYDEVFEGEVRPPSIITRFEYQVCAQIFLRVLCEGDIGWLSEVKLPLDRIRQKLVPDVTDQMMPDRVFFSIQAFITDMNSLFTGASGTAAESTLRVYQSAVEQLILAYRSRVVDTLPEAKSDEKTEPPLSKKKKLWHGLSLPKSPSL